MISPNGGRSTDWPTTSRICFGSEGLGRSHANGAAACAAVGSHGRSRLGTPWRQLRPAARSPRAAEPTASGLES